MPLHVHLVDVLLPEQQAQFRAQLAADITLTWGLDPPDPARYEILVAGRPTRALLVASPLLRALIVPWAGLPETTRQLLADFPQLTVHNLHHNADSAAEMALALLLAAAKALVPFDRALRANDWRPRYGPNPAVPLVGRTALILGFGAIGRRVAQFCGGLGMEVLAVRRRLRPEDDPARIFTLGALSALLPRADVLIIALPLTPETDGLIGAAELALLPPRAILVNVARGPIVEERALFEALACGRLHAAGLDVWYQYPAGKDAGYGAERPAEATPPSAFPFQQLDNVVLSPHRAGGLGTVEVEQARLAALADMLNAAARGEPLPNRIDLAAGY